MSKKLFEIAAEIVQSQTSSSPMSTAEIASSLREVFRTLQEMDKSETGGIALEMTSQEPAPQTPQKQLTPAESIQENKVICLECGAEMRQLTQKHLVSHGMNQKEYRRKYGFTLRTPLAAKSLTKARSKAAKKRGLPANLVKFQEEGKAKMAAANPVGKISGSGNRHTARAKRVRSLFSPKV